MTLIEVIVAMFLIFVLFVVYLAALNTVSLIKKNTYADTAYHVANKQIEALRDIPYDSLADTAGTSISDPDLSSLPSGGGSYTISEYAAMSGLKEIVVTVTWNDGNPKSITLQTLAGSGGINQ